MQDVVRGQRQRRDRHQHMTVAFHRDRRAICWAAVTRAVDASHVRTHGRIASRTRACRKLGVR
jgi:hypothetical protein